MKEKKNPWSRYTCYMCDAVATTGEHAPPQGLFLGKSIYRKQLITVPSCKLHNEGKSMEDDLFRCIVAGHENHNRLGFTLMGKVMRKLVKNPHLTSVFTPGVRESSPGRALIEVDLERFYASIESIVRALYYHQSKYQSKLLAELTIIWQALRDATGKLDPRNIRMEEWVRDNLPPLDQGANPRIFQYRFDFALEGKYALCRLRFFEGLPIYVRWEPQNRKTVGPSGADE